MKETTKNRILKKAILMLSKSPQLSMEETAKQIGISRATLYRYFRTKDALLKEIILEYDKLFNNTLKPILTENITAKEQLVKFLKTFIPVGANLHFLLYNDIFLKNNDISAIYGSHTNLLKDLCINLKNDGELVIQIPDEWMAATLEFLMYAAWEKIYKGEIAVNKAADYIIQTFFKGFGK